MKTNQNKHGDDVKLWSIKQLKTFLEKRGVSTQQFTEKSELVNAVLPLLPAEEDDLLLLLESTSSNDIANVLEHELFSRSGNILVSDLPPIRTKVCGKVFKEGDLAYNCATCQNDGTCVQCKECFDQSDHTGHAGITFHRTGSGGTCDCGDFESWKEEGCCQTHRELPQGDPTTSLPLAMHTAGIQVLSACVQYLFTLCKVEVNSFALARNVIALDDSLDQTMHVLLHNDDYHTFEEVISALQSCGAQSTIRVDEATSQVHHLGRCEVFSATARQARDILSSPECLISRHKLLISFAKRTQLELERCGIAILKWIQQLCMASPALARVFVTELIRENLDTQETTQLFHAWALDFGFDAEVVVVANRNSLLDCLIQVSNLLPKVFVLQLRELFLHLIPDEVFKTEVSCKVGEHLPQLASHCAKGLGVEEDSLLQMSFHFFTSKIVAKAFPPRFNGESLLMRSLQALKRFFDCCELPNSDLISNRSIVNRKHRLFFQAFRYQVNVHSFKDCSENELLALLTFFQDYILSRLTFLDPHSRRTQPTHVDYESEGWATTFDLSLETFLNLIHPMTCALLLCPPDLLSRAVECIFANASRRYERLSWLCAPDIFNGKFPISFHLPEHRFAAHVWTSALVKYPQLRPPSFFPTPQLLMNFVDYPLRLMVASSQISLGEWVRNGQNILIQKSYYRDGARFSFADLDIRALAVALCVEPNLWSQIQESFQQHEVHSLLMQEEFLKLCIDLFHCLPSLNSTEVLRRGVIHSLALYKSPLPLTDLVQHFLSRRLMLDSSDESEDEQDVSHKVMEVLKDVAIVSRDKHMERKFLLKPSLYVSQVDPYSWFISQNEREEVQETRETMWKTVQAKNVSIPFCPLPPLSAVDWFLPLRNQLSSVIFVESVLHPYLENAVLGNDVLREAGVATLNGDVYRWSEDMLRVKQQLVSPGLVRISLYLLTLALHHQNVTWNPSLLRRGDGQLSLLEVIFALYSQAKDMEALGLLWILERLKCTDNEEFFTRHQFGAPSSTLSSASTTTKASTSKKRKASAVQSAMMDKMKLAQQRSSTKFQMDVEEEAEAVVQSENICSLCREQGNASQLGYYAYSHASSWVEINHPFPAKPRQLHLDHTPVGWTPPLTTPSPARTAVPASPVIQTASTTTNENSLDWGMATNAHDLPASAGMLMEEEDDEINEDEEEEAIFETLVGFNDVVAAEALIQDAHPGEAAEVEEEEEEEEGLPKPEAGGGTSGPCLARLTSHGLIPPRLHVRSCGHLVHLSCLTDYRKVSNFHEADFSCSLCKATSNGILLLPQHSVVPSSDVDVLRNTTWEETVQAISHVKTLSREMSLENLIPRHHQTSVRVMLKRVLSPNNADNEFALCAAAIHALVFTWGVEVDATLRNNGKDLFPVARCEEQRALFESFALGTFTSGNLVPVCTQWMLQGYSESLFAHWLMFAVSHEESFKSVFLVEIDPIVLFVTLSLVFHGRANFGVLRLFAALSLKVFYAQSSRSQEELRGFLHKLAFAFHIQVPSWKLFDDSQWEAFFGEALVMIPNLSLPLHSNRLVVLPRLFPNPLQTHFVALPLRFDELYAMAMHEFKCPTTHQLSKYVALCLLCGEGVCAGSMCCKRKRGLVFYGAATSHVEEIGAGLGVFLLVHKCQILLLHGRRAMTLPAPYVDAEGYPDPNLTRGKPLYLNVERYESLQRLVAEQLLASEVLRSRNELQRHYQVPIEFHF